MSTETDLRELNTQLELCVQELHNAIDFARKLDERDELLFDLDDLTDVLSTMETICNKSECIEEED